MLRTPDFETFKTWANEARVPWGDVLKRSKVTDPAKGSRMTAHRASKGGSPIARRKIFKTLMEIEVGLAQPTRTGTLLLGIEEWRDLGGRVAEEGDGERFLGMLRALRDAERERVQADQMKADAERRSVAAMTPFTAMQPPSPAVAVAPKPARRAVVGAPRSSRLR